MLVLNQEEFQKNSLSLESVMDLSDKQEVATLLDCWNHALNVEGVSWYEVTNVYKGDDDFYYFVTGSPSEPFRLFQYIEDNGGPELDSLTARKKVGTGRGVPTPKPVVPPKPETAPAPAPVDREMPSRNQVHINTPEPVSDSFSSFQDSGEIAPEDEDEISTGFFEDDDDEEQPTGYTGAVYTLVLERLGERFEVGPSPVRVGRGTQSEVQIQGNRRLSRVHAMFTVRDDVLYVEDMGSSNGTYVNDYAIDEETRINSGDVVSLGGENIEVTNL